LVNSLEELVGTGELKDTELFLFTDNTVAEAAYYWGTSSNPLLFELVLRLHKLEMQAEFRLHVLHVPGTRVMTGKDILWFVPLNYNALERAPNLLWWVRAWVSAGSGSAYPGRVVHHWA
jgi:hypothetical protein